MSEEHRRSPAGQPPADGAATDDPSPAASLSPVAPASVSTTPRANQLLQHGAGWVAALAAAASVVVTLVVGLRDGTPPPATPAAIATPAGAVGGPAAPGSDAPGSTGASVTPPPRVDELPAASTTGGVVEILRRHSLPQAEPYAGYQLVRGSIDDISIEAPTTWDDTAAGVPWLGETDDDHIGVVALATPSERELYTTFTTPGVFFAGSDVARMTAMDADDFLDDQRRVWRSCQFQGRGDYRVEDYVGRYEVFAPCGSDPAVILQIAAHDEDRRRLIYVFLTLTTDADFAAAQRVLDSLRYAPAGQNPGSQPLP